MKRISPICCGCMPKHPLRTVGDNISCEDCMHRSVHWAVKLKSVPETLMCRQYLRDGSFEESFGINLEKSIFSSEFRQITMSDKCRYLHPWFLLSIKLQAFLDSNDIKLTGIPPIWNPTKGPVPGLGVWRTAIGVSRACELEGPDPRTGFQRSPTAH